MVKSSLKKRTSLKKRRKWRWGGSGVAGRGLNGVTSLFVCRIWHLSDSGTGSTSSSSSASSRCRVDNTKKKTSEGVNGSICHSVAFVSLLPPFYKGQRLARAQSISVGCIFFGSFPLFRFDFVIIQHPEMTIIFNFIQNHTQLLWNCSETALKLLWIGSRNCSEIALKLLQKLP